MILSILVAAAFVLYSYLAITSIFRKTGSSSRVELLNLIKK